MTENNEQSAAELTAGLETLLEEQLALYGRLRGLADRQRQLVTQDDPQPLLALLGERQKVVDQLAGLSERLVPAQRAWRSQARDIDPARRQQVEGLLQRIGHTLQSVLDSDAEDARHLAARKQHNVQGVERIGEGQRALCAYQATSVAGKPQFVATDHSG